MKPKVAASPCPRCQQPAPRSPSNPWRPFCSERCKLIDLGDWLGERYRVPVDETPWSDTEHTP